MYSNILGLIALGVTRSTLTPKISSNSSARSTNSNPIGFSKSTRISTSLLFVASFRVIDPNRAILLRLYRLIKSVLFC